MIWAAVSDGFTLSISPATPATTGAAKLVPSWGVSTGFAFGASVLAGMLIQEGGTPTGDTVSDALELSYAQSVGPDGYAATKNLSPGDRAAYWGAERDRQMVGGGRMSAAEAQAERNRQQTGSQENPDDCASCGGNGLPVFLRAGQFGACGCACHVNGAILVFPSRSREESTSPASAPHAIP